MSNSDMSHSVVEALILASPEPLPARKLTDVFEDITPGKVTQLVCEINQRYADNGMSYRIRELAGGYQFYILPAFSGYVEELFTRRRKMRLTRAALETLAIVAYKQPVTKSEIEHIRGVSSDGVLQNLLEKNMVTIKGRAETVGKPLQYGTTDEFLKFFGLNNLKDLPKMSEIEELLQTVEEAADESDEYDTEISLLNVNRPEGGEPTPTADISETAEPISDEDLPASGDDATTDSEHRTVSMIRGAEMSNEDDTDEETPEENYESQRTE